MVYTSNKIQDFHIYRVPLKNLGGVSRNLISTFVVSEITHSIQNIFTLFLSDSNRENSRPFVKTVDGTLVLLDESVSFVDIGLLI